MIIRPTYSSSSHQHLSLIYETGLGESMPLNSERAPDERSSWTCPSLASLPGKPRSPDSVGKAQTAYHLLCAAFINRQAHQVPGRVPNFPVASAPLDLEGDLAGYVDGKDYVTLSLSHCDSPILLDPNCPAGLASGSGQPSGAFAVSAGRVFLPGERPAFFYALSSTIYGHAPAPSIRYGH